MNEIQPYSPKKNMRSLVDNLLDNEDMWSIFPLVNEGWNLTAKQLRAVDKLFIAKCQQGYISDIDRFIDQGVPMDDKYIGILIISQAKQPTQSWEIQLIRNSYEEASNARQRLPHLYHYIEQKVQTRQIGKVLFAGWSCLIEAMVEGIIDYSKTENYTEGGLKVTPQMQQDYFDQYVAKPVEVFQHQLFMGISQHEYDMGINKIKKIPAPSVLSNPIWDKAVRDLTKNLQVNQWHSNLCLDSTLPAVEKFSYVEELLRQHASDNTVPSSWIEKLHGITQGYMLAKQSQELLSTEQQFYLAHLYREVIPQLINNCLSMDAKSRHYPRACALVEQALEDIGEITQSFAKAIQEHGMRQMQVSTKYLTQVRKG